MSDADRIGRAIDLGPGRAGTAVTDTMTAPLPQPTEDGAVPRPVVRLRTIGIVGLGLVAILALALTVGGGGTTSGTPGLPGAGPLVDWGLTVATLGGRIAALGTVGALLFAAVLLRGSAGAPSAASRPAMHAVSQWAIAWGVATAISATLTLSQLVGASPAALTASSVQIFVTDVAAGRAAVIVVAVAGVVALAARRRTSARAAGLLLAAALSGLVVPAVLTGHSAAAENHLLAVTNLSVHVVAAAVWVGGLLALLLYGRDREILPPAAARFSTVALVCFLATGISGLLAAWLVVGATGALTAVLGTGYGWLLAGKTVALASLGVVGWHHRRRTLPRLRAGEPRSFQRFAAMEAGIMLATFALAVALSSSPPPAVGSPAASPQTGAQSAQPGPPGPASLEPRPEDMTGHDHGELSVTVLIDETRFHVSAPVAAGSRVTVHNRTTTEVTITASDGSFDVDVPGRSLITFAAPEAPGTYRFTSRHSPSFTDALVVR